MFNNKDEKVLLHASGDAPQWSAVSVVVVVVIVVVALVVLLVVVVIVVIEEEGEVVVWIVKVGLMPVVAVHTSHNPCMSNL
jgi:hypothetical protein